MKATVEPTEEKLEGRYHSRKVRHYHLYATLAV